MRIAVLVSAFLSPGCMSITQGPAPPPAARCAVGEPMVETMLFLGMSRPGGSVSEEEFQHFIEVEVAPRWEEGFTLIEAQGLWRSEQRNVTEREPSRVLVRIHPGGEPASRDIEAIRAAYVRAFTQDAVLRTDRPTCADF